MTAIAAHPISDIATLTSKPVAETRFRKELPLQTAI